MDSDFSFVNYIGLYSSDKGFLDIEMDAIYSINGGGCESLFESCILFLSAFLNWRYCKKYLHLG